MQVTKGFNSSFIALVPKTENPQSFNDFKPISLISSIYKILSKVLAFRIKFTIPVVVGEIQSAFSGGKNINDGILIANEVILFYFLTGKNCPQAANEVIDGWKR